MDQQFQLEIERMFNNNQLYPRIKKEFVVEPWFEQTMVLHEIPRDFGYSILVQMVLHKRANVETLVGIHRKYFLKEANPVQACADMILKAAEADLVDYDVPRDEFVMKWNLAPSVQAELDRFQFPMPMVIEPREVRNNTDTGYLTIRESIMLQDNHTEDDVCLDHINRMNGIRLRIDADVAQHTRNTWKGIDKPKDGEDMKSFKRRQKAFDKYNSTVGDVLEFLQMADGGECYVTHSYDKRGRCYARGYHINPQGNEWNKAMIHFAHEEVSTR